MKIKARPYFFGGDIHRVIQFLDIYFIYNIKGCHFANLQNCFSGFSGIAGFL
jgi:hypothetical protein